jgi:Transposase DDE domain
VAADATGVPLGPVSAGANRHDSPLLAPTLDQVGAQVQPLPAAVTLHLDRGYDSHVNRALLDALGFGGEIARKGVPAPVQTGKRWVVERLHSWMNHYGKLRRCTDREGAVVDFYLYLAAAFVAVRQPIQRARTRYRWPTRPTTRRLKWPHVPEPLSLDAQPAIHVHELRCSMSGCGVSAAAPRRGISLATPEVGQMQPGYETPLTRRNCGFGSGPM